MPGIIGREAELEQVREFLAAARGRMTALQMFGPAGIGKSTLWQAALDEATTLHGFRVVSTRPSEAEAQLPFAALNDLFGSLLDEVQPDLAPPQRLALDIALLRAPVPPEGRPAPLAISLATLGLIRAAAAAGPTIVAVDDVPWLDAASASVLDFVVRRLDGERVGLIVAQRTSEEEALDAGLVGAVPQDRRRDLRVNPISARETGRLLGRVLRLDLPPSSVARVHRMAAGNPFYAIEIGRAMQRRGLTRFEGDVTVPSSLTGLVLDRLAHLGPAGASVVRYASALSQPSIDTLEAALGHGETDAGLSEAIAAEIVVTSGRLVRFSHPLLAAEAYGRMSTPVRTEVHRRLATVVTEVEERATHLDISASGHDEQIAGVLDAAAVRANERGAPEAAAEYAERAIRRAPGSGEALVRRRMAAALYRLRAGDVGEARAWLESALADAPAGSLRAEALIRLGEVRLLGDDWRAAEPILDEALEEPHDDVRLRIEAMVQRAGVSFVSGRHRERGATLIAEAMRLAEELGDPRILARVIGPYARWQWATGQGDFDAIERRARELVASVGHLRLMDHFDADFAAIKYWRGSDQSAGALYSQLLERAEERGDYSSIPSLLGALTRADFYGGRADEALARLEEAERLARATGLATPLQGTLAERAIVNSRTGRPEAAWEAARVAIAQSTGVGLDASAARIREELAVLELSRHNPARALEALGEEVAFDAGTGEVDSTLPTRAEALVGLGRLDEAADALDRFAQQAAGHLFPHDSADVDGGAGRTAALLAAARGELAAATRLVTDALATYAAVNDLWSRARTLLVAADIHRRARRRADARAAASEALALFEHFGAALWTARARELVGRIGAVREEPGGLTPTQAQVADLAVAGLTNRQIGDRLFMSVHTVEAHLSAAYRTLGIQSRRQLAAALRDAETAVRDSPPVVEPEA